MSRLLSADFSRLWKSKLFWGCIIFNFVFSYMLCKDRSAMNLLAGYKEEPLESVFFNYAAFLMIIIPMFNTLFIGTEYSDGTIRNKLIFGHSRFSIYMSNLIVCSTANLLIDLSFMLAGAIFGIPLLGFFEAPFGQIIYLILCTFLSAITMTALVAIISMLNQNKATAAVTSIVICCILMLAASMIDENLQRNEFLREGFIDSCGELQISDPKPNPDYIGGTERKVLEFLDDCLPTGQAIQVSNFDVNRSERWWYLSLLLLIPSVGTGYAFFRRKDIR